VPEAKRLARHHELRPDRLDQRKLVLSPDEECLVPPLRRLVGREQPESRHWPRLALEGKRLDRFHRNGATNKRQRWFSELAECSGDTGGRAIIEAHGEALVLVEIDADLRDVDAPQDLAALS